MSHLTRQWAGVGSTLVSERQLSYDSNGNPVSLDESLWGSSRFGYNSDGRLENVESQHGLSENFTYDEAGEIATVWTGGLRDNAVGARPAMGSLQMRFIGQGGRLEKVGETQFIYDADGRAVEKRIGEKLWRYEWSVEGQLRAVVTPEGERWTYEYDAFGRRVKKSGPRGTTTYVWDGSVVAEEIQETRSASWHFEPGTFRPIAKVENGVAYACVTDQVGTPRELVTRTGKLAWSIQLTAFGEVQTTKVSETDCPIRFQGQWFDEESGLHYNWNRYYEPETGNYLSADPIGLDGGTRSYGYVHNPLRWIDPCGLASYPGVDFTGSPDLFPVTGSQQNIVTITMQGSRQRDFVQAYQQAGISKADAGDYTWHHVDDFNPTTGETTMQLVKTSAHVESFPHTGSVSQFEEHFGVDYGTPESVRAAYDQGWLKGKLPKDLQELTCK